MLRSTQTPKRTLAAYFVIALLLSSGCAPRTATEGGDPSEDTGKSAPITTCALGVAPV